MIGPLSVSRLPAVYFDGHYRVLGCLPETAESVAGFPLFAEHQSAVDALDPSLWQEIDTSWFNLDIKDQGATSACVGHGSASGMEACYVQSGRPKTDFNAFFVYGFINGGRDAGAMISDGLKTLMANGVCPQGDLPKGVMFRNQFPAAAVSNGLRFRLEKAYRCPTFEDICGAISLGFVCPLGLWVGDNFSRLDSDGVAPVPAGGGGGHCVLGVGLKKSAKYGWLIHVQNSWGLNFGMKGFCYLHKGHFQKMAPDAFAIQTVMDDPQDSTPTDEVPVVTN